MSYIFEEEINKNEDNINNADDDSESIIIKIYINKYFI